MKSICILTLAFMAMPAFASISQEALKAVPGGKILSEKKEEVKVQTPSGSVVEVEFNREGKLKEASGNSIGDNFVPGGEVKPLKEIVASLQANGKEVAGDWSLDKHMIKGWRYEIGGTENGKPVEYEVDARNGKVLDVEND